tara:strand:+ start:4916 stop:5119 length:204 start_codon:yes stop_codon:yes gene_type:complete
MKKINQFNRLKELQERTTIQPRKRLTKGHVKAFVIVGSVFFLLVIWLLGRLIEFVVVTLFQLITSIF